MTPCNLLDSDKLFRQRAFFIFSTEPEDGGSRSFRNVSSMCPYTRRDVTSDSIIYC